MDFKQSLENLKKNTEFKEWEKENKESYLSYIMVTHGSNNVQIGFYNNKKDKISTFFLEDDKITDIKQDEVFKEPGSEVSKLDIEKITVEFEQAEKTADDFQKKEYSNELPTKKIFILQNIKDFGNIWNVSLMSLSFNVLNIKINAEKGDILSHKLAKLMEFQK